MAYIYPNGTLKILHNVNLNHDYDHTIYFDGRIAQSEYFLSKAKYTLDNQSYQRKERGFLQVNIPQWNLFDCTYLMFKNQRATPPATDKWFYAFINSVDYVNENVSIINFEIDVIQTWMFDYSLEPCFVDREHTSSDELFENTIEEKLDIGDIYYNAQISTRWLFDPTMVCVVVTADLNNHAFNPAVQGNYFTGVYYKSYDLKDSTDLANLISFVSGYVSAGLEDNIITIFQYPRFIGHIFPPTTGYSGTTYVYTDNAFNPNLSSIDGYAPKNNKLFCYPYNYLSVSDKEGNGYDYKWELWYRFHRGEFRLEGCVFGKPTVQIVPKYYRDVRDSDDNLDYESGLVYDNFPVCSWSGDSYQVWLAQNKNQLNASALEGVFSGIVGLFNAQNIETNPVRGALALHYGVPNLNAAYMHRQAAGQMAQTLVDTSAKIGNLVARNSDAKNLPHKYHGNPSSAVLNIQNESSGFELKQMTVKREYAIIIDQYFSKFGYACRQVKVPNTHVRTNWTYTKTVGCELTGNIPSDDASLIKSVYDHGITFWSNGNNVGNYGDFTNPVLT